MICVLFCFTCRVIYRVMFCVMFVFSFVLCFVLYFVLYFVLCFVFMFCAMFCVVFYSSIFWRLVSEQTQCCYIGTAFKICLLASPPIVNVVSAFALVHLLLVNRSYSKC